MKKILIALFLASILLFTVGCGSSEDTRDKDEMTADAMKQYAEATKSADADNDQELVNFKCTMAGTQTYYFYENKIKIEGPGTEGWVVDDVYYVKMDVGGKDYLISGMGGDNEITTEGMLNMYRTSKATPNFDCTLGGVSESKVTPPDLPMITAEEMGQVMMGGMAEGMEDMY